jgi:hypothetical protein
MEMRAHVSRLAWHDSARLLVAGKPFKTEAAIATQRTAEAQTPGESTPVDPPPVETGPRPEAADPDPPVAPPLS